MSITLIGKKIGMTQVFDSNKQAVPVTAIQVGPCPVVQVKNRQTDGYEAVQVAFGEQKEHRLSQAELGHLAKAGVKPMSHLGEFHTEGLSRSFKPGEVLLCSEFKEGEKVDVSGTTKGHGFQGVVKRYRMKGQPATHGSMMHRRIGSIGARQWPGEVWKGKRMPGHMGVKTRTTQNLLVVRVIPEHNVILVKGSVHGSNGGIVYVSNAVKSRKKAK